MCSERECRKGDFGAYRQEKRVVTESDMELARPEGVAVGQKIRSAQDKIEVDDPTVVS